MPFIVAVLVYFATAKIQTETINAIGGERRLTELDLPWVEAGKKALVYSKKDYTFNNGVTESVEWGAGRWRTQSPRKIVAEAFACLEKIHA
nr:hypothetical protein [uncultured Undibacterium sp.]